MKKIGMMVRQRCIHRNRNRTYRTTTIEKITTMLQGPSAIQGETISKMTAEVEQIIVQIMEILIVATIINTTRGAQGTKIVIINTTKGAQGTKIVQILEIIAKMSGDPEVMIDQISSQIVVSMNRMGRVIVQILEISIVATMTGDPEAKVVPILTRINDLTNKMKQ